MLRRIGRFLKRLDLDTRMTLFGLFLLLLTWVMDFFVFGPSFDRLPFLFLFALMIVFFILLVSDRLRFGRRLMEEYKKHRDQVEILINSRLPGMEFIRGEEQVEAELTKAALDSKRFIIATGGQSKIERYLEAIARKVLDEGVTYTRIIFGDHIHHELCTQLCSLVDHHGVRIAHAVHEKSGTVLVTDNVLIFTTIPSTHSKIFDTIIKVPDPLAAEEYREYLADILHRSTSLISPEQIKVLCRECREKTKGHG